MNFDLIKKFEGCKLKAYQCSAGVWTIGYGHTKGVMRGDTCTQEQADFWLEEDIEWAKNAVKYGVDVKINQNQFDALVSFTFNVGASAFKSSNLLRQLNKGNFTNAAAEFLRWNHANGKVVAGLTKRREAERDLFNKK